MNAFKPWETVEISFTMPSDLPNLKLAAYQKSFIWLLAE